MSMMNDKTVQQNEQPMATSANEALLFRAQDYIERAAVGIVIISREMRFRYINPAFCRFLGYTADELMQKTVLELTLPEDRYKSEQMTMRLLTENQPMQRFEKRYRTKSGAIVWAEVSATPLGGAESDDGAILSEIRDITIQKQMEAALEESESLWRSYTEHAPIGMLLLDDVGRYLQVNPQFCKDTGYSEAEFQTMQGLVLTPPEDQQLARELFYRIKLDGIGQGECSILTKQGQKRWASICGVKLSKSRFLLFGSDITEKKASEEALANAKSLLDAIVNSTDDQVWSVDPQTFALQTYNHTLQKFYRQWHGVELQTGLPLEARIRDEAQYQYWRNVYLRTLEHESYSDEYYTHTGNRVLQLRTHVLRRDDQVIGIAVFGKDITELKQAEHELRQLAARLSDAEERERRRIARELHDQVGQNLTAISFALGSLYNHLPFNSVADTRQSITDVLRLLEETTGQVRTLMLDLRPVMLDDYGIFEALQWYGARLAERTGITIEIDGPQDMRRLPPDVETALFRITQEALTNITKYARASTIFISLEVATASVRLSITDDGIGFASENQTPTERGGWGLMIMRERAQAVGGHVRIESTPGQGTCVIAEIER